jgi:hypothetical protein
LFCWSCVKGILTLFFILAGKQLHSVIVDYKSKLNLKKETILVGKVKLRVSGKKVAPLGVHLSFMSQWHKESESLG